MNSEDRKKSILDAAIPLFAAKGLNGTTTREIADAAGVSEALLYRHFSSKDELFFSIQMACCGQVEFAANRVASLESSTNTLMKGLYLLMHQIVFGSPQSPVPTEVVGRIMLRSLAEDGRFAAQVIERLLVPWVPKFQEWIKAAEKSGDLKREGLNPDNSIWFTHHMAVALKIFTLSDAPVVPTSLTKEEYFDQAVIFIFRGLGFTPEAIDKYGNPQKLRQDIKKLYSQS